MSSSTTSLRPWQPGQSGNARGLNVKYRQLIRHCRVHSRAMADRLIECANDHDAPWAARVQAANAILDRAWGKAPERIEVASDSGQPMLTIRIVDPGETEQHQPVTIEAEQAPDNYVLSFGRRK